MCVSLPEDIGFKSVRVHRLVLTTFKGPCPKGYEGCHNDGDKSNNHLSNIRWDTRANNLLDKIDHGTDNRGERCGNSILIESDTPKIFKLRGEGKKLEEIANVVGVSGSQVSNILRRKRWAHVEIQS